MSRELTPEQQLKILAAIWGDREDDFVFLPWIPGWAKNKEERKGNWNEGPAFRWPSGREQILKHLEAHAEDDLYFSVNTFAGDARIAQYAGEEICLWADLDEVDPRTDIDFNMRPTIAWESSPGRFQAVWLMDSMHVGASEPGNVNHRLTAAIGADPSGWDCTQVLRVPGRPNFKPEYRDEDGKPAPGKLLWVRRFQYSWDHFADLPEVYTFDLEGSEIEERELSEVNARAVWQRVRLKCNSAVRRFMSMREREVIGGDYDRSEILWQIERELADAGCSILEIVALVRTTPWNKHSGRRNEINQLRTEAIKAKAVAEEDKKEQPLEGSTDAQPKTLNWFSELATQPIPRPNWLVHNIWAKGACGFISGEPKSYKSYVALDLALSVALGEPFLNDAQFSVGKPRKVLYLQEEDTLPLVMHRVGQILEGKDPKRHWHGYLTAPGEITHDADAGTSGTTSGVYWMPPTPIDTLAMQVRTGFIASDPVWQSWLAEQVESESIELVVIDTLGTTMGDIDGDKASILNDRILKPLKMISDYCGCAIAVVHHNKKGSGDHARAGQAMLGSVALHAWVESALYVRSKEPGVKGGPSMVKVDREDKLAQDYKFRMYVPTMWHDNGEGEGQRVVWTPEIRLGWGDDEDHEVIQEIEEDKRKIAKRQLTIVGRMKKIGVPHKDDDADEMWTDEQIINLIIEQFGLATNQSGHIRRQMDLAAERGQITHQTRGGWRIC